MTETKRNNKTKDLIIVSVIYILAFLTGFLCSCRIEAPLTKLFVFDIVATIVTFIFSVIYRNSSVYDAYWSLTPMVMSIWLFAIYGAFSPLQLVFLIVFNIWSLRLTLNWCEVFTDFSYEDWRYQKYRNETPWFLWPIVNFFGIHMMPTLVVFAGMLPLFEIAERGIGYLSFIGIAIMLMGICFELFADKAMHKFLSNANPGEICNAGLWKYTRHPNYFGEISFWTGVFVSMIPYAPEYWYYGIGFVSIIILFNVVSIPLMENRQLKRRPGYAEYREKTSRLVPFI